MPLDTPFDALLNVEPLTHAWQKWDGAYYLMLRTDLERVKVYEKGYEAFARALHKIGFHFYCPELKKMFPRWVCHP